MENRIPIDELFHDKLSQGKEQMNLGAWANMERLLDGKNPYATEEDKKKRGLIPFFFVFLLGAGLAGATYFYMNKSNHALPGNDAGQVASTPVMLSQSQLNEAVNSNENQTDASAMPHASIASINEPSGNTSTESSKQHSAHKTQTSNGLNKQVVSNTNSNSLNSSAPINPVVASANQSGKRQKNTSNSTSQLHSTTPKSTHDGTHAKGRANTVSSPATALSGNSNQGSESAKGSQSIDPLSQINSIGNPQTEKIIEKIPVVSINQKEVRMGDGSVKGVINDTMGTSMFEKVTERPSSDRVTASLDPMITNPRYKVLSQEEEQNARRQSTTQTENQAPVAAVSPSTPSESAGKTSEISINSNQKSKQVQHTGYFEDLRKFFTDTYNKVYNFMVYSPKPNVYTGMNAGFNASFSNSIGGFHGGFTMLAPLSDYFSILTELKFFDRINGGYTVNDISYGISNQIKDTASIIHQSIYSYTKDSSVRTYNIKNFYSLELPLMIQLNSRSFAFYGGVNLAYSFKLKTTDKVRMYHTDYHDTLQSSQPYAYPVEKGSQLQRDDFAGRFGLGYTIGASYNFSPQLYVDLRLGQNVWDNMKSNTARDISNGFFKVPSIQFSLGYRFRKFTPDN